MNVPSAKMDKSRDVRRKTSLFSRQQINTNSKSQQHSSANLIFGFNGGVGDFVCLEKPKKEKIRRLSSVNSIQHCKTEMGSFCCCDLSSDNRENQCPSHSQHSSSLITKSTTKRFKIPRKFSDDCNVVDHASVPRKLRSAMKKRGHEAISPHSPDSRIGVESHRKDGAKKPKLNLKQGESNWSKKATVSGPITKDEEEVVETLYALAGMFPNGDSMEVKSSAPPETLESPITTLEVKKEDTNSVCLPQAAETVPSSTVDKQFNEADKLHSLNEPSTQDQPDSPDSKRPNFKPDSTISGLWLNTAIPSLAKSEPDAEKSSSIHGDFNVLSEQSLEARLKQPQLQVTNLFERKPEMAFRVTDVESQIAQRHKIREPRKNSLALWPDLSSTVPLGPQSPSSSQLVANKIPTWLDAAKYGPRTCSLETGSSIEEVLKITMDRNAMKRSATHVYISRLIHNLQMQDNKDGILQQLLWLKPHVGLKQTDVLYPNNCSNLRYAINGNIHGSSATDRNSFEDRSGIIPQQKLLHREQPLAASASGMNTSQGQSFDFLSLSAGGVGLEANNNSNEVPFLHSVPHHQSLVPFSIPPTCYTSSTSTDQLSTATATQQVHLLLPKYSSPFCGPPFTSHSGVTKQQQQQQRLWAAHLAAQYRPHGTSTVLTQFSSRQQGKPESSTLMACAQTAVPPHSTLDAVDPKYYTVPQHQQPKIVISSSLPSTGVKRTDHHFSSVYEESNGELRAGGVLPLQLLHN